MKRYIRFAWALCFLLLPHILLAYTPRVQWIGGLNQCVRYIHAWSSVQHLLHQEMEALNRQLIQDGETRRQAFSVTLQRIANIPLSDLFEQAQAALDQLPPADGHALQTHLQRFHKLGSEWQKMGELCKQLGIQASPNTQQIEELLTQFLVWTEDMESLAGKFYFDLNNYARHYRHSQQQQLESSYKEISVLIGQVQSLSTIIRKGQSSSLEQMRKQLIRQAGQISKLYRAEPQLLLLARKAQELGASLSNRPSSTAEMHEYAYWGSLYYPYNYHWLPLINHPQDGILQQYNDWVLGNSHVLLLTYALPKWFKIVKKKANPAQHLVFLVDVSGSMRKAEKLPLLQELFQQSLDKIPAQHKVSLVTFSGKTEVLLSQSSGSANQLLSAAIAKLQVGGESPTMEGIQLAYQLATASQESGQTSKIIMITDGGFEINEELPAFLQQQDARISLHTSYIGQREHLVKKRLHKLAALGKGSYLMIRPNETASTFQQKIWGTNEN